jgi:hypothetical protein
MPPTRNTQEPVRALSSQQARQRTCIVHDILAGAEAWLENLSAQM